MTRTVCAACGEEFPNNGSHYTHPCDPVAIARIAELVNAATPRWIEILHPNFSLARLVAGEHMDMAEVKRLMRSAK